VTARFVPRVPLFHLVDPGEWAGGRYEPDLRDGFVHYSFAGQVAGTADRHYPDAPALVALEVDPARLGCDVRVENGFPHGYGPLPAEAVVATHGLERGADGRWTFSATGPASRGR
jgi:uncharacterized protein (DUF952 family)